ncbi:hypothetical protein CDL15_Pgr024526 [Punica granatum]|uniref:Uncharacterized protein n=1 Tax=Punica granatum TaxID=22663 RepID=A0A218XYB3_PUNGR|nr:hypothetical protein CDL15_Pgr024526 [Punica granatum]PKI41904.1 hypothetical protein CRG98_037706 [Punica granatum]
MGFWKAITIPLLYTYSLLDYVEGRFLAPSKTTTDEAGSQTPNLAYCKWVTKDKFVLTCIMLVLTEDIGCNKFSALPLMKHGRVSRRCFMLRPLPKRISWINSGLMSRKGGRTSTTPIREVMARVVALPAGIGSIPNLRVLQGGARFQPPPP